MPGGRRHQLWSLQLPLRPAQATLLSLTHIFDAAAYLYFICENPRSNPASRHAALLDANGISDFNGLHSRNRDGEVQLYAFDCLAADGDDLRRLPLSLRKTNLARILARRIDGIHVALFERARSGQTCSGMRASSALKGWSVSTVTAPTAAAGSIVGSR
jgi:hypothetical protein